MDWVDLLGERKEVSPKFIIEPDCGTPEYHRWREFTEAAYRQEWEESTPEEVRKQQIEKEREQTRQWLQNRLDEHKITLEMWEIEVQNLSSPEAEEQFITSILMNKRSKEAYHDLMDSMVKTGENPSGGDALKKSENFWEKINRWRAEEEKEYQLNQAFWKMIEEERAAREQEMQEKAVQLEQLKQEITKIEAQLRAHPNNAIATQLEGYKQTIDQFEEELQAERKASRRGSTSKRAMYYL